MNIFSKVTSQSLRKNRTRTIAVIIAVILSTAMVCAVTTFANSLRFYGIQDQIYRQGNWHGRVLAGTYQTYERIRDSSETEDSVVLQQLGYAVTEGSGDACKPYIYLLGLGEGAEDILPIHLIAGSFPAAEDEILLPEHLVRSGGREYRVGDTWTLSLGVRVLDGRVLTQETSYCHVDNSGLDVLNGEELETREERTYTVTGFYERLPLKMETNSAPGYTAFTRADGKPSSRYLYDTYFRMKHPGDLYSFLEENDLGDSSHQINQELLAFSDSFRYHSFLTVVYRLSALVLVLILLAAAAVIYNAFSLSVSERTRQFGLLSSIGATWKQLHYMVLLEALTVSAIGIPLGILSGIGGIGAALLGLGDLFANSYFGNAPMTVKVSPVSVLIAAVLSLLAVIFSAWIPARRAAGMNAIEAIHQSRDVTAGGKPAKTAKLTYVLFGLPGVLASRNVKRSRKKARIIILSLLMSMVLFLSAAAFTDYLTEAVGGRSEYTPRPEESDGPPENGLDRVTPGESKQDIVKIVRTFSCGFVVLISLIAASNVFHTIYASVTLRTREYAMLASVGMTRSDFRRMMYLECLLIEIKALVWAIPISFFVAYLLYRSVLRGCEATFHLPWLAVVLAVVGAWIVVLVSMMYAIAHIRKGELMESLKNENI